MNFFAVGAGTTGSVVANRLSESYRVLLLEAGGEPNPLMSVPAMGGLFLDHPSVDWRFLTTPQAHSCLSLKNKVLPETKFVVSLNSQFFI